jgi:hypothetical protein
MFEKTMKKIKNLHCFFIFFTVFPPEFGDDIKSSSDPGKSSSNADARRFSKTKLHV